VTAADAARLILRLFHRKGGLRLPEALADGYAQFLRPAPTPGVMRRVHALGKSEK
jgi:hypothetical protein